jgi:thioredoxin reductase
MAADATAADVLVVGAGPAGLSAAVAAAECGKRVVILDAGLRAGGQIWRHRDVSTLPRTARRLLERADRAGITIRSGARVIDAISPSDLLVEHQGAVHRVGATALVIATGARERMLPFPGWTLPGVVGIGGLQALVKNGLSLSGARVVIAGTGPLLLPVAASAARAGARIAIVAEQASAKALARFAMGLLRKPGAISQAIGYRWAFRRAPFRTDSWVVSADGTDRVRSVTLSEHGRTKSIDCDWLATGMGLVPGIELAQLLGCALDDGTIAVDEWQSSSVPGVWAAGECTGVKGDAAAIAEGEIAGRAAAGDRTLPGKRPLLRRRDAGRMFGRRLATTFELRDELLLLATPDTIVCRCEDVRRGAIDPRWTQRQAKLWTRIGMGECQGAVCGAACAALFGWEPNIVRPPLGTPPCGDWAAALGKSIDDMDDRR